MQRASCHGILNHQNGHYIVIQVPSSSRNRPGSDWRIGDAVLANSATAVGDYITAIEGIECSSFRLFTIKEASAYQVPCIAAFRTWSQQFVRVAATADTYL